MKKLALLLVTTLLTSAAVFTFGQYPEIGTDDSVGSLINCGGPKRDETSNGVQVKLEICGSDLDGYDLDAANPDTGEKWDCTCKFTLTGESKKEEGKSIDISKEKKITVSSTAKGWFNAEGESGLDGKKLKISSFSVSCTK